MSFPIGVMFTASADLQATLAAYRTLGIRHGQMAIPGDFAIHPVALAPGDFQIHTLFGVYTGESYNDLETVRKTVGFLPPATRTERITRTLAIVDLAAALNIPGIATHVGCIPEDPRHPDYTAVVAAVREIADAAARHRLTFALETGQETAEALLEFLVEVDRENVGVNFDPANMLIYGTGDPVDALDLVSQHLLTVHCKDGTRPTAPGALGVEMPIGQGLVDFPAFLTMLLKIGYEGPLFIEREIENAAQRMRDIADAKLYLEPSPPNFESAPSRPRAHRLPHVIGEPARSRRTDACDPLN